jgi:hypothetical protein
LPYNIKYLHDPEDRGILKIEQYIRDPADRAIYKLCGKHL